MVNEAFLDTTIHFERFSVETNRRIQTQKFLDQYEFICSDDICRKIGDMLIAIDGRNYAKIASTNKKEFDVICQALSKKRISPFDG